MLWEIGHVARFQEKWVLRRAASRGPLRPDADMLYDAAGMAHDTRWDLPLPSREQTLRYTARLKEQVLERLAGSIRRASARAGKTCSPSWSGRAPSLR